MTRVRTDHGRKQNPRLAKRRHRPLTFRPRVEPLEPRLLLSHDANMGFVAQAYLDLLERPAEPAGLNWWTNKLDGGAKRGDIAGPLTHSSEYDGNEIVKAAYENFFGRDPESSGLNYWIGQMQHGLTDEKL